MLSVTCGKNNSIVLACIKKKNCKGRIQPKGVVKDSEKMPNRFEPN